MAEAAVKYYKKLLIDRGHQVSEKNCMKKNDYNEGGQNNHNSGKNNEQAVLEEKNIHKWEEQSGQEWMQPPNSAIVPTPTSDATTKPRIENTPELESTTSDVRSNVATASNPSILEAFLQNPSQYEPTRPQPMPNVIFKEFPPETPPIYRPPLRQLSFPRFPDAYHLQPPSYPCPCPAPPFRPTLALPPPPVLPANLSPRLVPRLAIWPVPPPMLYPEKLVPLPSVNHVLDCSRKCRGSRKRKYARTGMAVAAKALATDRNYSTPQRQRYYCEYGEPSTRTNNLVPPQRIEPIINQNNVQQTIILRGNGAPNEANMSNALAACGVPGNNIPEANLTDLFLENLLAKRIQARLSQERNIDPNRMIVNSHALEQFALKPRNTPTSTIVGSIRRPWDNVSIVEHNGNDSAPVLSPRLTRIETERVPHENTQD